MRLDKFLSHSGLGTRKEVRQLIRQKAVTVDGVVITDPGFAVDEDSVYAAVSGQSVRYRKHRYFMLNKPPGVVSATEDGAEPTVVQLLAKADQRSVFPVGRLDKDTTGLLLLTDDGALAHRLLSPHRHVEKEYIARLRDPVDKETVRLFAEGLVVDEGFTALPARLVVDPADARLARVTVTEGKYHQVKRMFTAVGNHVEALQRVRMGALVLDGQLREGEYRELTDAEYRALNGTERKTHAREETA